jgi:hypothetical protein
MRLFSFFPDDSQEPLAFTKLELAPVAALRLPVAVVSSGQSLHHSE